MHVRTWASAAAATIVAAALLVGLPSPASAATFTVNSNGDQPDFSLQDGTCSTAVGTCTLRAAVMQANASAISADVVTVPAMTITLGTPLVIGANVTVTGAGGRSTLITGTPGHGLLSVSGQNVVVQDLALQGASSASSGGAVYHTSGSLTLRRLRIVGNSATATNGAVYSNGDLLVDQSEVSGNTTTYATSQTTGGGIAAWGPTLVIRNSTVANNVARFTDSGTGAFGGGVFVGASTQALIESTTFSGNRAQNTFSASAPGGNLYFGSSMTTVTQSVVADGVATSLNSGNCGGLSVAFTGRNIVSDTSCGAAVAARTIANPQLLPLAANGGQTDSRAPAPGSPALDAVAPCAAPVDQRGQARPMGGACDLGAVELGADLTVGASLSNASPGPGTDSVLTVTVANSGADTTSGTSATIAATGGQILSATPGQGTCSGAGSTSSCAFPDLAAGGVVTVLVSVRAPQAGTATYSVSVGAQQPDPNPTNNSAAATATVPAAAPPPPSGGGTTTTGTTTPAATACSNPITGNGKPNKLAGTAGGDRINGKAGNDRIKGKAGEDCLNGAGGNDLIVGGPGADKASGGPGADTIKVRDGIRDRVTCGGGRDTVIADRNDTVATDCEVIRRR